jgi:hypothetical protein
VDPVLRGRDGGRSLTIHPALGPARGRDLADRAVLGLVGRDLTGLVDRVVVGRVDLGLVDRVVLGPVDRVVLGLVGPGLQGLTGQADLVDLDLDLVARADRVGLVDLDLVVPVGRVDLGPVGLVDLAVTGLAVLVDRGLLVGLEDPAVQDPTDLAVQGDRVGLAGRVDLAARVDRHRPRTGPKVPTIGVTRKWAARVTRRTASAHPTTVRRHRPGSMDSAGTADLLPEGLRLTGMARRLRVAGTVLRLPVAGTLDGMGRRAT